MHGIPTIGFGPGHEHFAHAPNEQTETEHLVRCTAFYAAFVNQFASKEPVRNMTSQEQKITDQMRGRDWLMTQDWSDEEINLAIDTAVQLKKDFKSGITTLHLPHKTIFLIFFDKSTRTRNSFEAGITQLGGHAHFIDSETSQIAHGESPKDMGIILSGYGHGIAIRHDLVPGEGQSYMRDVAKWADVPVINMQCDIDHPCQTLADLMTIREEFGKDLSDLKIAVSWAYAPSYVKPMSVPQGLIMLMTRFGMDVSLAHPPEYTLMERTHETCTRKRSKIRRQI